MKSSQANILAMARATPILRARDVREAGLATSVLSRMVESGQLERVARGVYRHPDSDWNEHIFLSAVSAMMPKGVVVLLSALNFHGIGTHQAHSVWVQIPINFPSPKIKYPPIEIVRTRLEAAFSEGVDDHNLNGVSVSITNPARTVADCFKHRNKLGLELCLEALREIVPTRCKIAEVLTYAKMNQVERLMLPYLEMLA
jgi:predicted transcriptional regulator of viral defense system